jgi:hypothetical protein
MKKKIKFEKALSAGVDKLGRVFEYNGNIYRGIKKEAVPAVDRLIDSGLIKKLVDENLFPKTKRTDFYTAEYPLILQHQKIKTVQYPQEWSFDMLKDAAITTLKVNKIAKEYGFQTIDAHPFNIMFNFSQPMFVDMGSFGEYQNKNSWFASEEFQKRFFYPLRLWSAGFEHTATKSLIVSSDAISHFEYLKILFPLTRVIPSKIASYFLDRYFPFARISSIPNDLIKTRVGNITYLLLKLLKKNNLLPFQNFSFEKKILQISRLRLKNYSYWSNYQSSSKKDYRFNKIISIIKSLRTHSMIDLASNRGYLATSLIENKYINEAVSIDYDRGAINQLYTRIREKHIKVSALCQDIIFPTLSNTQSDLLSRFKSDLVVALAITHHLVLSQYIPIEKVFEIFASFSKKYILVEFMPLGLWNGQNAPPIPEWYNEKWFVDNLSRFYSIEGRYPLEKNRILFVGKVRKNQSG